MVNFSQNLQVLVLNYAGYYNPACARAIDNVLLAINKYIVSRQENVFLLFDRDNKLHEIISKLPIVTEITMADEDQELRNVEVPVYNLYSLKDYETN